MALYTPQLVKQVIDPQYHSKNRTEIRLDNDRLYSTRLRLVNLSVVLDGAAAGAKTDYALNAGVYSIIKNAFLYSGSKVIDQLLQVNRFMAFKQFNRTNEDQLAYRPLTNSKISFYYGQDTTDATGDRQNTNEIRIDNQSSNLPSNDDDECPSSHINLSLLFPVLKTMPFISTTLFPNLRVVLEYDLSRSDVLTGATGTIDDINEPQMVCEYFDNEETKMKNEKAFRSVVWNCIENDSVFLPSVAVGTEEQRQNWKLNGFNNKIITRCLIQKEPSALAFTPLYKKLGSEAMPDEEFDLRLNGSSITNQPVRNRAEMIGMVADTWGECVNFPSMSSMFLYGTQTTNNTPSQVRNDDLATHHSYFGLQVPQQRVQDLQLSYRRDTSTDGGENKQALKFNVFAEVPKALSVVKGEIVVSYQ